MVAVRAVEKLERCTESTASLQGSDPALFPVRLYFLLEDASRCDFEDIVSWTPSGDGFKIHKRESFAKIIMPRYFKTQTRIKSFLRQLNLYKFGRAASSKDASRPQGCYYHKHFVRGRLDLCQLIHRNSRRMRQHDMLKRVKAPDIDITPSLPARVGRAQTGIGNGSNYGDSEFPMDGFGLTLICVSQENMEDTFGADLGGNNIKNNECTEGHGNSMPMPPVHYESDSASEPFQLEGERTTISSSTLARLMKPDPTQISRDVVSAIIATFI